MPDRPREREELEEAPDPEPWENRQPPAERPRHEGAVPEDPDDPTERTEAIAAASYGEIIEVPGGETVDGDFNGTPELEGLEQTSAWQGTDVLGAMEGREVEALREADVADGDEVLAGVDEDVLREQLARIDTAIDQLERRSGERRS